MRLDFALQREHVTVAVENSAHRRFDCSDRIELWLQRPRLRAGEPAYVLDSIDLGLALESLDTLDQGLGDRGLVDRLLELRRIVDIVDLEIGHLETERALCLLLEDIEHALADVTAARGDIHHIDLADLGLEAVDAVGKPASNASFRLLNAYTWLCLKRCDVNIALRHVRSMPALDDFARMESTPLTSPASRT